VFQHVDLDHQLHIRVYVAIPVMLMLISFGAQLMFCRTAADGAMYISKGDAV
jgi:hypothetical protein